MQQSGIENLSTPNTWISLRYIEATCCVLLKELTRFLKEFCWFLKGVTKKPQANGLVSSAINKVVQTIMPVLLVIKTK